MFRAFQGWTSLSDTGPGEGTLRVYPLVREMTAYTLLRPLFRERVARGALPSAAAYLAADNWELDTESARFPGAPPARSLELRDATHPHLQLARTMVSIPRVRPGDQAWWHADVAHAVESTHAGTGPSAVMYIPSVPVTRANARYLAAQRAAFAHGVPPPDFPGGDGEAAFAARGKGSDVAAAPARRAMGLAPLEVADDMAPGERAARRAANEILGFAP